MISPKTTNARLNLPLFTRQYILFNLVLLTVSTRATFGRLVDFNSGIEIDVSLGGNSPRFYYVLPINDKGENKLRSSSAEEEAIKVPSLTSSAEEVNVRKVPKHVEELYYKGHPVQTNEDKSKIDKNFARFSEAYLDVVKEMQRICGGSKLRHRKKRMNRAFGKKSKESANQDLLSMLCQNSDSTEVF